MISVFCIFFLCLGSVAATDVYDDMNNLNLNDTCVSENLEVSSEDSISETNLVNSHDDNLDDYPIDVANEDNTNNIISNDSNSYFDDASVATENAGGDSSDKDDLEIVSNDLSTTYKEGNSFNVTVNDNNGNPVEGMNVTFTIYKANGNLLVKYNKVTNANGVAGLTIGLAAGKYTITTSVPGAEDVNNTITVTDGKCTIATSDLNMEFKDGSSFNATVTNGAGKPVVGEKVTFTIMRPGWAKPVSYTATTNANGVARLSIGLAVGKYTITTSAPYASSVKNTITVNGVKYTIATSDLNMEFKDGSSFNATVTNGAGKPVVGEKVTFTIMCSGWAKPVSYTATTDANGVARLSIGLAVGKYTITTSAPYASSVNNIITVSVSKYVITANDLKMSFNDGSSFKATVTSSTGKPISGVTVTFTFYKNGNKWIYYNKNTNADGVASLPIGLNVGTYTIKSSVGDSSVTNTITVTEKPTISIETSNIELQYRDGTQFNATIKDAEGNVLKGVNVTFTIRSSTYIRTTNADGVASLPINLYVGTHTISTSYDGQKVTNTIKVVKADTKIIGNSIEALDNAVIKYDVKLVHSNTTSPISDVSVNLVVNGKSYGSKTTNSNGIATFDISGLPVGSYKAVYSFKGTSQYNSASDYSFIKLINSTTVISGKNATITYGDDYVFNITLKNVSGDVLPNKEITVIITGSNLGNDSVVETVVTDENGVAHVSMKGYNAGTYSINYNFSSQGHSDYSYGSNTIVVNKKTLNLSASNITKEPDETTSFDVLVTDENNNPVEGVKVLITIGKNTYNAYSNENGTASLKVTISIIGIYETKYQISSDVPNYSSDVKTAIITVNGFFLTGSDIGIEANKPDVKYNVTLTDVHGNSVAGKDINLKITGSNGVSNTYTATTDDSGVATFDLPPMNPGVYTAIYSYMNYNGKSTITVSNGISLNSIITAANNLKKYIENNAKLPATVAVDGKSYSTAEFLYLLAKATIALNSGNENNITPIDVNDPSSPSIKTVSGNLYLKDYLVTAQDIIDYMEKNGIAPNSLTTALGTCGYEPLVYAFARVVAFYGNNGMMPNYVSLKTVSVNVPSSPLNSENTIPDDQLYKYLEGNGWKCDVTDPQIVALAQQLTAGLDNELAKATALFNYVRDKVSYSFYYNSQRGATKTLFVYKSGNCCDQANALIALYRAAGLHSRYVHGTCTFTSGSTYGHVWTQVLIGDTWVVADPTSTRNSFGVVNNWNNYYYTLHGYYAQLSF